MPSEQLVEITTLLEPLAGDNNAGFDVRQDPSPTSNYSQLRDARKAARAEERNNLFDRKSSARGPGDGYWSQVMELAPAILRNESKDLEVACWYTEALLRKAGFQGLRDGFMLLHELIDQYWDNLYPLPDEDGLSTRVFSLTGLNGEGTEGVLIAPMRDVPITETIDPGPYNYWQYKQVLEGKRVPLSGLGGDEEEEEYVDIDKFRQSMHSSSGEFYVNLRDDLRECLDVYRQINETLNSLCGTQHAPPTSNIINTLEEILGAVLHEAELKFPQEVAEETTNEDGTPAAAATAAVVAGPVKSREDAFRQLAQISKFFRQTEPHSPISYVLEKAVNWGNMTLAELIEELIPDTGSRHTYSSLTGVKINDE